MATTVNRNKTGKGREDRKITNLRKKIETVKRVTAWGVDEDIIRVLEECNNDESAAIDRIILGDAGRPGEQWVEVSPKKKKDNKIQQIQHSQYQKNRPYYNRDSPKNHRRTGNGGFRDYKKYQSNGNTHPISTNGNTQQQLNRPAKENIQTAQPVSLENANPSLPPSTTPPAQSTPETNPTPLASTPTPANKPIESNNDKSINLPVQQAVSDNKRDTSVESPKSPRFVPKKRFDGPSSPNPLRTSNGTQSPKSQKRSKLAKGRKEWKPKPKQEGSLQIGSPRDQDNSTTEELSTPEILNVTHHDESEDHSSDEDSDSSLITLPSHLVNREASIKVRFRDSTPKEPQITSQPQNSTPKEAEQPKEIPSQQPSQSQTTDKKESSSEVVSSSSTTSSTESTQPAPVQPAVSPVQGSHPAYVGIRPGPRPLVSLENDSMGSIPIHFPLPNYMGPINPYPFDIAVPDQMFYAPEHLQMASGFRGKAEASTDPKSTSVPDSTGKFPQSTSSTKRRGPNHSSPNPNAPATSSKSGATPPDGSIPPAGYRPYPPQFAQAYPGAYSYPYLPSPGQFSQYPMRIPYYKGYPNYQNAAYPDDLAQDGGYPIPGYFPQDPNPSALPPVHHVHHRGQNPKAKSAGGPVTPASNPPSSGSSTSSSSSSPSPSKSSQPQGGFSAISGADLANGAAGFKSSHHPQGSSDGYQPNYYHPSADYNQYGH